jgi:hypothetical protein
MFKKPNVTNMWVHELYSFSISEFYSYYEFIEKKMSTEYLSGLTIVTKRTVFFPCVSILQYLALNRFLISFKEKLEFNNGFFLPNNFIYW